MAQIAPTQATPKKDLMYLIARAILVLIGWKLEATLPEVKKFVLLGAPHTTNWDFIFMLLLTFGLGIRINWMGKDSLFRPPLGGLMRRLGGISVTRHSSQNYVQRMVDEFNRRKEMILAVAPEGTRSYNSGWKSGFYYIASGANVPIALGFVDYSRKMVGIGPCFMPSGDIEADFPIIRNFYASIKGKFPEKQSPIQLKQK